MILCTLPSTPSLLISTNEQRIRISYAKARQVSQIQILYFLKEEFVFLLCPMRNRHNLAKDCRSGWLDGVRSCVRPSKRQGAVGRVEQNRTLKMVQLFPPLESIIRRNPEKPFLPLPQNQMSRILKENSSHSCRTNCEHCEHTFLRTNG